MKNTKENINSSKIELGKYRLETINHFLNLADQKNSIGLVLDTISVSVLTGFGMENFAEYIRVKQINGLSIVSIVLFCLLLITFISSIFCYVSSLIPRNNSTDKIKSKLTQPVIKLNTFYYRHISLMDVNSFIEYCTKMDEDTIVKELLEEVSYNSIICNRKMNCFKRAIILTLISITFALLFFILTIFL